MVVLVGFVFLFYRKDERYVNMELRRQYLWIELKEVVEDFNDVVFIRFLVNVFDLFLVDFVKYLELIDELEEFVIFLDFEFIRVIRLE